MSRFATLRHLSLVCGFLVSGCSSTDPSSTDDSDFAISQVSLASSILPVLENTTGSPNVCLALIGYEAGARRDVETKVRSLVTDALNQWNRLLRDNPEWSLKTDVTPIFTVQDSECPRTPERGFGVNVWATAELFKSQFCAIGTCASSAQAAYRAMYLGPWNRDKPDDPLEPFTVAHELGHLLGLGDTYKIPGGNDWQGDQPASLMNGESRTLTEDDKLGLWVVLRSLKTGRRSCEGFGQAVEMTVNRWNVVLCSPLSAPASTHGTIQPSDSILPEEGGWTFEGISRSQRSLTLWSAVRSGAGTEFSLTDRANGGERIKKFKCDNRGSCANTSDDSERILLATTTSLRLITTRSPAGMQATFAGR